MAGTVTLPGRYESIDRGHTESGVEARCRLAAAGDDLTWHFGAWFRNTGDHARTDPRAEAGQGVQARAGEWVRYSTPGPDSAEYVSVCVPAFTPGTVHRDG
jgi:hypothetical protein